MNNKTKVKIPDSQIEFIEVKGEISNCLLAFCDWIHWLYCIKVCDCRISVQEVYLIFEWINIIFTGGCSSLA